MVKKLCIGVCILLMSAGLCAENNYENDINILKQHLMSENHGVVLREITHCNYSKYEAESAIRKWDNIQQFPSNFLYEIDRDVGEKNTDQYASHLYVWECLESVDKSGYAAERLYWKWTDNNQYPKDQIMFMHQDTLFYDFVMRIDDNFAYADITTICDLNVFVFDESTNSNVYLPIESNDSNMYDDNTLSIGDFRAMSATGDMYVPFTFYTIIGSIDSNLISNYGKELSFLKNINFEVYWHDKDNLYIDYFRVYDDVYNKLENGGYDDMIANNIELFYPITELSFQEIEDVVPPSQLYAHLLLRQKVKDILQKNKFTFHFLKMDSGSILKKGI